MERAAEKKESRLIVNLDFPFENPEDRNSLFLKAQRVLEEVHPYACGAKFNYHLVLPLGVFDGVEKLVRRAHDLGLMAIMDCKVNDIGSTNQVIAEYYFAAGFDALIANPFVGWEEGLKPVFEVARRHESGVILLVYMSHKAAGEGYGQTIIDAETGQKTPQYIVFARKALEYGADGAIVGATYPEKIREIHGTLGAKVPIYSPGVGVQGGEVKSALESGARYILVGRTITLSEKPGESARQIRDLIRNIK